MQSLIGSALQSNPTRGRLANGLNDSVNQALARLI